MWASRGPRATDHAPRTTDTGPECSSGGSLAQRLLFLAARAPRSSPAPVPSTGTPLREQTYQGTAEIQHGGCSPRMPVSRENRPDPRLSQEPPEVGSGPESQAEHQDSPVEERKAQEAYSGRSKSPWYSRLPRAPLLLEWAGARRTRKLRSTVPPPLLAWRTPPPSSLQILSQLASGNRPQPRLPSSF